MDTKAQEGSNTEFQIPADVEARLRAAAAAQVAATYDEATLLAQYVAEARAKREEVLRAQAGELDKGEAQDLDNQGFPKKYFKLIIFKGGTKTDLSYVPVGVNGYVWKIARGEQVIVPSVVVEGLNHAVTEVVVQSEGGLITRPAHRFPYQIVGEATEKEYQDFRVKMREAGKTATPA